ncbi:T7SS effector LXG polymorphic toxin [Bacillus velezensis]|uniref:T7SS effector LXG polymorphic toxin n=1 Tax=Bacillus velezensis TaxID=492670 RepID=UPI0007D0A835|nr:T7SS effector LXG polymorphic toxin [Bacillus velezensis]OAL94146.1 hypothetical protein AY610_17035 [Bacillus velezensis]
MKIFEATTLLSAAKQRANEYKELRNQMTNLKNAFLGMADLGDSDFSGKGADNIKALFQDHAGVTDEWLELIDMKIAFLTSIEAMIEDAGLSDSYVEESFLEHELTHALDKSKAIMQEQRNEMKGILDEIADILPLDLFSTDNVDQKLDDSDTTKRDTIHKIGELDNNLSNEYGLSEANEAFIMADFQALQDATGKGKNATPLNYNAKAYRESEIHQMQAGLHKQSSEYLSFKKQQAEERRIAKEQEELSNRPWYEKTWDVVCNFTGEVTGYYDYKRAADGVDPVTGEKLTAGQRVAAGGMAAAGYIPIVGWAGRIFKGGKAIYSTGKAIYKADKALEIYKTPKTFKALQNSDKGLYGLASANGFSEAITGRDMFGNKISDEERNNSIHTALAAFVPFGVRGVSGKLNVKANGTTENFVIFNKTHKDSMPKPKGTGPSGGRLQSHHGLQQQWAKENLKKYGYDANKAPTITIETGKGFPHTEISKRQNMRRNERVAQGKGKWESTLQEELNHTVEDLKAAGFSHKTIENVLEQQYKMLEKLGVKFERIDLK